MQCEMCGKDTQLFTAELEGSMLNLCESCAKYGKMIKKVAQTQTHSKGIIKKAPLSKKQFVELIVDDFAAKIRNAREKLQLNQEDFAKKLNEKISVIHHFETGKMVPSLDLARKLEKALHITLVEMHEESSGGQKEGKSEAMTIGDIVKIHKRG